jgi:predicted DNA-binding transcriptional regulator AlpA
MDDDELIGSRLLKQLLENCSDMHIWRLCHDEKYRGLDFPQPIRINNRNYWRRGGIRHWISSHEAASRKASAGEAAA